MNMLRRGRRFGLSTKPADRLRAEKAIDVDKEIIEQ